MKKEITILIALCIIAFASVLILAEQLDDSKQLADAYKNQLIKDKECSPLGFCVGDVVTSNRHAMDNRIDISGIVVKVSGEILTVDETGYEDFRPINEAWVKHDYMVQPQSKPKIVNPEIQIEVVDIILV